MSVCLCKAIGASSCNLSGAVEGMCVNNSAIKQCSVVIC